MHAHGAALRKNLFSAQQTAAIIRDFHHAGLEESEVAMMELAAKVALDANAVTEQDIENLRAHGYSDTDILNITMIAAARTYFSKVLDAMGMPLDEQMQELDAEIRQAIQEK